LWHIPYAAANREDAALGEFWLGIIGVAVGSIGQFFIDRLRYNRETKAQRELDDRRKELLKEALENPPPGNEWRQLQTLSRIIGANYETTTRLLIEIGARGSETENEVWALRSEKPLGHTRT
jgi:hypothetical protein